jgi:acetoacetyl-CoA synthetase
MSEPGGWIPDEATLADANFTRFMAWLAETDRGEYDDYRELWAKSVDDIEWFWDAVWSFFDIQADQPPRAVLGNRSMPGAEWFPGATLNYATEVFRHATDERPALIVVGEDGSSEWSWARLQNETAAFAAYLRGLGVKPGDSVVGYLPNVAEAVVAALAAASVGAIWAVCNQDVSADGVIARLGQVEPAVLVASEELTTIRGAMPTLRATVVVPRLDDVEPAVVRSVRRLHHCALRRQPNAFDHRWPLAGRRRGRCHGPGRQRGLPIGLCEKGIEAGCVLLAGGAARRGLHRFAAAGIRIPLGARGTRPPGPGGIAVRWDRCVHGLHRRLPDVADGRRRAVLHLPGRGHRILVRRTESGDR